MRNITTTTQKTPDGKHYIVDGKKKICSSMPSNSISVITRHFLPDHERHIFGLLIASPEQPYLNPPSPLSNNSTRRPFAQGGPEIPGTSMFLIPRLPGIQTRKIEIGADGLSATIYITFEDVKVLASYLIGEEGKGFQCAMSNFNRERLWIAFQAIREARICLQDAVAWC